MKIALLGWGSLIWDARELPREGVWQEGGPVLPIEFSRVSQDCRLTPVIDPVNGTQTLTRFVMSPRADLDDAIRDLATREGTNTNRIGFVDLGRGESRCAAGGTIAEAIRKWAREKAFDAVVWTDLPSNFAEETGQPFSVENAQRYLEGLPSTAKTNALKYISNALPAVSTPLRRRLSATG